MIIKGSSRGQSFTDIQKLSKHLLNASDNEKVSVMELKGVASDNLHDALKEFKTLSLGTRTRKAVYHASINLGEDETTSFSKKNWMRSVKELEKRLGLEGHQRAIVQHKKNGRTHIHVVWGRIHPETLKTASDSHNYRKHEQTSRFLENLFSLKPVIGVHTRPEGTSRPIAIATHQDWQASERTKISVKQVSETLKGCWSKSDCGLSFAQAVSDTGLTLCVGTRGFIILDRAGTPHSLSRRLQLKAKDVKAKLADLDPKDFPTVDEVQNQIKTKQKGIDKMTENSENQLSISVVESNKKRKYDLQKISEDLIKEGIEAYVHDQAVWYPIGDSLIEDRGDKLTIHSDADPTEEEIAHIVAVGKKRCWKQIRFFGGNEEFQQRAKQEALKQGYKESQIILECEEGKAKKEALAKLPPSMPDYMKEAILKKKAGYDPENDNREDYDHEYSRSFTA